MDKKLQWVMTEQVYLVLCNCGMPEHQLIAAYTPEDDQETLYLHVHLGYWEGFWRRLWAGLRYAFGYKSRYGEFDEICLNSQEARSFAEFLLKFVRDVEGEQAITTSNSGEWVAMDVNK